MTATLDYAGYSVLPVDNLPLRVWSSRACTRLQADKEQFKVLSALLHFPEF